MILTNEESLAQRLDAIAYPGFTANSDLAKSAALGLADRVVRMVRCKAAIRLR